MEELTTLTRQESGIMEQEYGGNGHEQSERFCH